MVGRLRRVPGWKLFGDRRFRLLWSGASLSMLADQAFLVALTWLVLRVAGSGVQLGIVLAVAAIPGTVLMPLGGVLSDRFSPAPVLLLASVARALLLGILAVLVFSDATRLWHIYFLASALSAMDALYYPASMSVVPTVVEKARLGAANALAQGAEQISGIAGPMIAAAAVTLLGLGSGFAANALLFFGAACMFAGLMRVTRSQTVKENAASSGQGSTSDAEEPADRAGAMTDLLQGLRYAWRDPIIRTILLILVGINAAMVGPLYVGGATLAQRQLGGVGAFGALVAAASLGALIGSLIAGSIGRIPRRGLAVLGITASLGLGVASIGFASSVLVAAMVAFGIGGAASFLAVINVSWLQERSQPELTGRVMGLAMFAAVSLDPISFALAGALVELNLKAVFLGGGLLLVLTALLGTTSRAFRESD